MHGVRLIRRHHRVGSKNISTTGIITATSASVTDLPTYGQTVYMRLASKVNGVWQDQDYTYTASGVLTPAFLTRPHQVPSWRVPASPSRGTPLHARSSSYPSGPQGWDRKTSHHRHPHCYFRQRDRSAHVRADSLHAACVEGQRVWQDQDYTYTASGVLTPAFLTTPTPGTSWRVPASPSRGTPLHARSSSYPSAPQGGIEKHLHHRHHHCYFRQRDRSATYGQTVYMRLASKVNGSGRTTTTPTPRRHKE